MAAFRFIVLLNVLAAVGLASLLATGAFGHLERGFPPLWQIVPVAAAWVAGAIVLWTGRGWGWYLTVAAATVAALVISCLALMLFLFHGVPSLRDFATAEGLRIALVPLVAWGAVISLFHPAVSRRRAHTSG
jgi:hypothetical protein